MKRDIVTMKISAITVDGAVISPGTVFEVDRVFRTLKEEGYVTRHALKDINTNRVVLTQVPDYYFTSQVPETYFWRQSGK